MIRITKLSSGEEAWLPSLVELLRDSVDGGASVGFLPPLSATEAGAYWRDVLRSLDEAQALWIAEDAGEAVGTVQLALPQLPNSRHRAEVKKLLVKTSHRSKGIASRLLEQLESYALEAGRSLLVLDTLKGSTAETVYLRRGWQRAGEIPDWAQTPEGLEATVFYFKRL
jgi:acetyltransferase